MSAPILVAGSVALDSIETPFASANNVLGGAAVHFSASASLYAPVRLVGVVGQDFPADALEFLRSRGVDLSGLATADGPSFRWRGRYELDMVHRETLELELGVFAGFHPPLPEAYRDSPVAFLANSEPDFQLDVLGKLSAPRLTACDTIDHWIEEKRTLVDELFSRVDLVFLNEDEARLYADTPNLHRAARVVLERGCRAVLIKKGENGAMVMLATDPAGLFVCPAYPLEEVVDPTGAGDAFAGGVLGALAQAEAYDLRSLRGAVAAGTVLASFAVEGFGPQVMEKVSLRDVEQRLKSLRALAAIET